MLYRSTKVKVSSSDGNTDYFNIVAGVLQRDILAPYLFIICLDYVLRTSIDIYIYIYIYIYTLPMLPSSQTFTPLIDISKVGDLS